MEGQYMDRQILKDLLRDGEITAEGYEKLANPVRKQAVISQLLYLIGGLLLLLGLGVISASILKKFPYPALFLLLGVLLSGLFAWGALAFGRKNLTIPCLLAWMASYGANWITARSLPLMIGGPLVLSPSFTGQPVSLSAYGDMLLWTVFLAFGLLYMRVPILVGGNALVLFHLAELATRIVWMGPSPTSVLTPGSREALLVIGGALYFAVGLYGDKRWQKDYSFWLVGIGATLLSIGVWSWSHLTGMPGLVFMVTALLLAIIGLVKSRIVVVIIAAIDLGGYGMHLVDVLWGQRLWVGVLLTLFGLVALGGGVFLRNRLRLTRRQPLRGSIWL